MYATTGVVYVVDEPYIYNRQAELGMESLPLAETQKLERISWEVHQKAQNVIQGQGSNRVRVDTWQSLGQRTPAWMKAEVRNAFTQRRDFYHQVFQEVVAIKGSCSNKTQLERFAEFFLCEVPILVYAYYADPQGIVDVYPGHNASILWQIEQGLWRAELPQTTEFALAGPELVYLDVLEEGATGQNPCR